MTMYDRPKLTRFIPFYRVSGSNPTHGTHERTSPRALNRFQKANHSDFSPYRNEPEASQLLSE